MNKPEWAVDWKEETFDYGHEQAYAAYVGPFGQAIRTMGMRTIEDPVYKAGFPRLHIKLSKSSIHIGIHRPLKLVSAGVYEKIEPDEHETHAILEDWFKGQANKCREFIPLAEERGW